MQRILSGERARCVESSEEFVTKKLCVSFIIVCAFFSILGGFFLGRYATEKAATSRKTMVEHKYQLEILNQLAVFIFKINNLTVSLSVLPPTAPAILNYNELYTKFQCSDYNLAYPDFDNFKDNVSIVSKEIIMTDLNSLQQCYGNISSFLESILFPG